MKIRTGRNVFVVSDLVCTAYINFVPLKGGLSLFTVRFWNLSHAANVSHALLSSWDRSLNRFGEFKVSTVIPAIGIAHITQLRTCVIKIVTFMGAHLMW